MINDSHIDYITKMVNTLPFYRTFVHGLIMTIISILMPLSIPLTKLGKLEYYRETMENREITGYLFGDREVPLITTFAEYLENYYLNWQLKYGRASIRDFSKWLKMNHALIINWMNGRGKPGMQSLYIMAEKMGPEVFDYAGANRPPKAISDMLLALGSLPEPNINDFEEDFDKWLVTWFQAHGFKKIK